MPKNKQTRRSGSLKATIIVGVALFGLLGGVLALAIIFPGAFAPVRSAYTTINLPLITTTLKSTQDGQDYKVQSLFSVQMDKNARKDISNTMLHEALSEIMSQMDLEELTKSNGIYYVNDNATAKLNEYLAGRTESMVFVTDLYVGDRVELANDANPERDSILQGLFKGSH
jgi:flagellar basal body-associated protein FliL